jgi:hypothetical protein
MTQTSAQTSAQNPTHAPAQPPPYQLAASTVAAMLQTTVDALLSGDMQNWTGIDIQN